MTRLVRLSRTVRRLQVNFSGGIANYPGATFLSSSVRANSADSGGGSIFGGFGFSHVMIKDSQISGNTAVLVGSRINNDAGTTTLIDTTATRNTAVSGHGGSFRGGADTFSVAVPLNDSKVSGDTPYGCNPQWRLCLQ